VFDSAFFFSCVAAVTIVVLCIVFAALLEMRLTIFAVPAAIKGHYELIASAAFCSCDMRQEPLLVAIKWWMAFCIFFATHSKSQRMDRLRTQSS
jgi:hypothetical protein